MAKTSTIAKSNGAWRLGLLALVLTLGGCEALYMMTGKGGQEALYKLPKKSRILVCVDPRAVSGMPADAPARLGQLIAEHMYQYKAGEEFVAQARLSELRKNPRFNPANPVERMGIADIAAATDADVVVFVDVLQFNIENISGGEVNQGNATAMVKVLDKNGKRLWPAETEPLGYQITAMAAPSLSEEGGAAAVQAKLLKDLALRAGRLFHSYDLEDKEVNPREPEVSN
ncbi:MAG: hypothetical protein WCI73_00010 [Phycisphaerae bacterium]